jgi:hypothetical protein
MTSPELRCAPLKHVFVVLDDMGYEGSEVVSVHATIEGANAVALTPTGRAKKSECGHYSVNEWEVEP